MTRLTSLAVLLASSVLFAGEGLRVGAASAELQATDDMVIAGSILPVYVKGQEGMLRAVATVVQAPAGQTKIAVVALDVCAMKREHLDIAAAQIEQQTGIPATHVLINCTHTHAAPSTIRVHGYGAAPGFAEHVVEKIVQAVVAANANLAEGGEATVAFMMGREETVGQNSRLFNSDGTIHWTGPRDAAATPTGPFDPDFPVMAFRRGNGALAAVIFGHSTHTIGGRKGGVRSPSFYGLAAQAIEAETGATVTFLQGASGSTHNLTLTGIECERRITHALSYTLDQTRPVPVHRVSSLKKEVAIRIREFNEQDEERTVSDYCRKRLGDRAEKFIEVFRTQRSELAPYQGQERRTWVQAMHIGDVAIVGIPAEFFTQLGLDIKRRSPFRYTIIAELADDHVGYVGNADAYRLGGYQLWMGHHSYTARGTGEMFVGTAVDLLNALYALQSTP